MGRVFSLWLTWSSRPAAPSHPTEWTSHQDTSTWHSQSASSSSLRPVSGSSTTGQPVTCVVLISGEHGRQPATRPRDELGGGPSHFPLYLHLLQPLTLPTPSRDSKECSIRCHQRLLWVPGVVGGVLTGCGEDDPGAGLQADECSGPPGGAE